jgi:hypothetical protein
MFHQGASATFAGLVAVDLAVAGHDVAASNLCDTPTSGWAT